MSLSARLATGYGRSRSTDGIFSSYLRPILGLDDVLAISGAHMSSAAITMGTLYLGTLAGKISTTMVTRARTALGEGKPTRPELQSHGHNGYNTNNNNQNNYNGYNHRNDNGYRGNGSNNYNYRDQNQEQASNNFFSDGASYGNQGNQLGHLGNPPW